MAVRQLIPIKGATDIATFKIFSEDLEIKGFYEVVGIHVKKSINKISSAIIIINDGKVEDGKFLISDSKDFIPGKKIKVQLGYESKNEVVFEGIVVKHNINIKSDSPSLLVIEAKHEAVKMTVGRKNAFFIKELDSEIISDIVEANGLTVSVDATKVKHQKMVQYNVTDWDFISMRADANGLLVYTNEKKLEIKAPKLSATPDLTLSYGDNIMEFEAEIDARHQVENVIATSWDFSKQELVEVEAKDPKVKEQGNVKTSDIAKTLEVKDYTMYHSGQLSDPELQDWANARVLRNALSKIRGRVKFQGYSEINPGDTIKFDGVGDRFNGNSFISGVFQDFDKGIWTTHVEFGLSNDIFSKNYDDIVDLPVSGLLGPIYGLQVGIVTSLEDEDSLNRIKVKIPIISAEDEGIWARIVSLDSGADKGVFFRPDVGDEVIVGFINDDPRNAIIIGAVHSTDKAAPFELNDDNFEKGIVTKEKLKLVFNDETKSILIETPEGNKITISEEEEGIIIEDQNKNKIEMNADGITIESAKDFTIKASGDVKIEGVNIEQNANSEVAIDGKGGLSLTTSAIAEVKGSLVKIN